MQVAGTLTLGRGKLWWVLPFITTYLLGVRLSVEMNLLQQWVCGPRCAEPFTRSICVNGTLVTLV